MIDTCEDHETFDRSWCDVERMVWSTSAHDDNLSCLVVPSRMPTCNQPTCDDIHDEHDKPALLNAQSHASQPAAVSLTVDAPALALSEHQRGHDWSWSTTAEARLVAN